MVTNQICPNFIFILILSSILCLDFKFQSHMIFFTDSPFNYKFFLFCILFYYYYFYFIIIITIIIIIFLSLLSLPHLPHPFPVSPPLPPLIPNTIDHHLIYFFSFPLPPIFLIPSLQLPLPQPTHSHLILTKFFPLLR